MSSRKRIQRKNPWQPTPAPDILQSRPFSNGKGPRESRLPTTNDILQTRPFSPRNKDVSTPKDTRSFEEKMIGAEFRYNGVNIPAFAPSEAPVVQREEEVGENLQEQVEGETSAGNISVFAPSAPPPSPSPRTPSRRTPAPPFVSRHSSWHLPFLFTAIFRRSQQAERHEGLHQARDHERCHHLQQHDDERGERNKRDDR